MSSFLPLPVQTNVVEGQISARISRIFHRWLTDFRVYVGFGAVPIGGVIAAKLTADEISSYFDATGLGKVGRWQGWAICNGSNGTDNADGTILGWETSASGGTSTVASGAGVNRRDFVPVMRVV